MFSLCGIKEVIAEETDQFTLPPSELLDLGPTTSHQLFAALESVVARTNSEIQMFLPRAKTSKYAASQLALRRKDSYLVDLFFDRTGHGFPRWLRWDHLAKEKKPIEYNEARPWKSIYWLVFSQFPLSMLALAPTINMYDYHFGTDKLGHFFLQGHGYYKVYMDSLNSGKSAQQAHAAIVSYGQILEQTFLGTLINGIYSNADLAANYAGWKFYMNVAHEVQIGDKTLPPILVLKGDKWEFSKYLNKDNLLKPFLSDNLNEAFNPSRYTFMRSRIRGQVLKRCADWIEREGITQQIVLATLEETSRWHGEAYGHWLPANNAVTLDTCFGGK